MSMFDENELNEIDMEQLLGISYEKFGELKEKLGRITEYIKHPREVEKTKL
jgi:hypothetical protein